MAEEETARELPEDQAPQTGGDMNPPVLAFDYSQLEPDVRADALAAVGVIRLYGKQTVNCIIGIGEELTKIKGRMPHGAWLAWLKAEFGWSDETARKFMRARDLAKSQQCWNLEPIDISAIYLLAKPSTPEPVREAALIKAASGERVTHASVKDEIERHKGKVEDAFGGGKGRGSGQQRRSDDGGSRDGPESNDAANPEPEVDEAKTAAFHRDTATGFALRGFAEVANTDPTEAAMAVDTALRLRRIAEARRLIAWLLTFTSTLEDLHARRDHDAAA